jgi:hypothetical protein
MSSLPLVSLPSESGDPEPPSMLPSMLLDTSDGWDGVSEGSIRSGSAAGDLSMQELSHKMESVDRPYDAFFEPEPWQIM